MWLLLHVFVLLILSWSAGALLSTAPVSKSISTSISLWWQTRHADAPHSTYNGDRNSIHSIHPVSFPTEQCESPIYGWVGDTTGLHHISMNSPNNCIMPRYPRHMVSDQTWKWNHFFIKIITWFTLILDWHTMFLPPSSKRNHINFTKLSWAIYLFTSILWTFNIVVWQSMLSGHHDTDNSSSHTKFILT